MKLRIAFILIVLGITMPAAQGLSEEICACVKSNGKIAHIVADESECRSNEVAARLITSPTCDGELSEDGRWCDQGDGTIKDMTTGLVWLKNANCIGTDYPEFDNDCTSGDGRVFYQHALDFVADYLNADPDINAGYTDWRMPTIMEMESIIDYSQADPALKHGHPFINVLSSRYWTRTPRPNAPEFRYGMKTTYGEVEMANISDVNRVGGAVWPVRGGVPGE